MPALVLPQMPLRSAILMVLTICAGGVIIMENPQNSLIAMHHRFVELVERLRSYNIPVFCQDKKHSSLLLAFN
jgi:hypothetical protein